MSPEGFAGEHGTPLLRLAVMLTGSTAEAEDLVQETFARLLRDWSVIERASAPRAYARRVLVNVHLGRRKPAGREAALSTVPDRAAEPSAARADTDEAWALLAELPRQQRSVLVLRHFEDLDDAEIASLLKISAEAVRTHASRGLATLRDRVPERKALS